MKLLVGAGKTEAEARVLAFERKAELDGALNEAT
jgi:hypothetical protein